MTGALKPGMPFSTRKPLTLPSSVRAHTTATSASEPLVIHIFEPLRTQLVADLLRARAHPGRVGAGVGLGQAEAADRRRPPPCPGSQRSFCSSLPQRQIANIASEPCTEQNERSPESPASSSRHVSPYAVADAPAQP